MHSSDGRLLTRAHGVGHGEKFAKQERLPKWKESWRIIGVTSELSLRQRKKLAARSALSHAAWSLMAERGLGAATPEAVAEAANGSPRTFRNYFGSREKAILHGLVSRGTTLVDTMRARPAEEPVGIPWSRCFRPSQRRWPFSATTSRC
ncbi:TetR/AcrR family transcriptional regulator [Streptomyces sp. NPDC006335]|uniref:TetR/AcrR family transcriptional regulator n=1 Tax=Streptomyces sp. NPDC006335 TaxID=3156895 RepID=UPI0033BDA047